MVHIVRNEHILCNEHEQEAGRQGKTGKSVGMIYTELYSTRAYPTQGSSTQLVNRRALCLA
jgi:hypothetical protein